MGIEFDKETVETFELGIKGYAFEQSLLFRAALFSSQYDDFQVSQLVKLASGTSAFSIRNAAKVDTKGVELETAYYWQNFEFNASLGLLDGKFDEFKNGGVNGEDLSGSDLPEVSDYTYNLGMKYFNTWSALKSDVTFSINYHYVDDYNSDLDGTTEVDLINGDKLAVGEIDGYGIVNTSLVLSPFDTGFYISLWAKNVTDEDSAVMLGKKSFFGARRNVYVDPQMYGVTLQYLF